jgi:hypothetical protein
VRSNARDQARRGYYIRSIFPNARGLAARQTGAGAGRFVSSFGIAPSVSLDLGGGGIDLCRWLLDSAMGVDGRWTRHERLRHPAWSLAFARPLELK